MSGVQSIISGILIVVIVLAGAGLLMYSQGKTAIERVGQEQLFFSHDTYSNNLDTMLTLTDNESNKTIGTLMSYSIYRRSDELTLREDDPLTPADETSTVIVSDRLTEALDRMFGAGNYYLNVTPRLYDVSLSFIIDGSSSLKNEREELGDRLSDIIDVARGVDDERTVYVYIFILSGSSNGCDYFINLPNWGALDAECNILSAENGATDQQSMYLAASTPVHSYKRTYDFRHVYRISYWDQPGRNWTLRGAADYYEPDWAAGTAYASDFVKKEGIAGINILFPMAGELSTGSSAHKCYTKGYDMTFGWDSWDEHFCNYCELSCDADPTTHDTPTENRSWIYVDRATRVAIDNNHIINPILAYRCNFYSPAEDISLADDWKDWNIWYYVEKKGETVPPGATHTFCQDTDCQGCTASHPDPVYNTQNNYNTVCFHPECIDELRSQMTEMATRTGGIQGDLNQVTALLSTIETAIEDNLAPFKIKLGTRQDDREQFVYTRKLPMPVGNEFVELRLHVYT